MFVLEFEKPLFEFAYDKPHCDLLFAFPPTFRSSTPSAIRVCLVLCVTRHILRIYL